MLKNGAKILYINIFNHKIKDIYTLVWEDDFYVHGTLSHRFFE